MIRRRLFYVMLLIPWLTSMAQDKYDKALEDFLNIATETDLRLGNTDKNKNAVEQVRNWKIEMPKDEKLRIARKSLQKMREERYGPRIESAGNKRRSANSPVIAAGPKTNVKRKNGAEGQTRHAQQPSKSRIERDNKHINQALIGAAEIHQGTKLAHEKANQEFAASDAMVNNFNPANYRKVDNSGRTDHPDFTETKGKHGVEGLDPLAGLDDEEPTTKNYDIEELMTRYGKDPYLLDCDEIDYLTDYLEKKIAEMELAKSAENKNQNTDEDEAYDY